MALLYGRRNHRTGMESQGEVRLELSPKVLHANRSKYLQLSDSLKASKSIYSIAHTTMSCASHSLHLGLIGLCAFAGTVAEPEIYVQAFESPDACKLTIDRPPKNNQKKTNFNALVDSLNLPDDPSQLTHIGADGVLRVFAADSTVLGYVRLTTEQLQHWIDDHMSVRTEEELKLLQEIWADADASKVSEDQIWNPSVDLLPKVLVEPQQEEQVTPAPAAVLRRELSTQL
ncbi:hypothetical protein AJ78_05619 [Emergomyces pasteurianus Ep9510]|uniref:Uncharacterized protein n=1 Tax=Emergomyces pasteurianus Ep9510 TaxID=1447872 RepID=A0A1J9PD87_9EURO|nr:hypothetical protein AJ78_05619 [Emergomyces pasteurianus Ep9510]